MILLFPGGAAAHGLLQPGDVISKVNDMDFSNVTHFTAWNYLKNLPEGNIHMTLSRAVTAETSNGTEQ